MMQEYYVGPGEKGLRLDQFLAVRHPELSRARLQALIREGEVRLNDKESKPSEKLREGARITLTLPESLPAGEEEDTMPKAEAIALNIVYEDDALLVLNKPAGLVVHPAVGNENGTLVNALLAHTPHLSTLGGPLRPGIVHRLDKETSGLLLVAKTDAAHEALARQFSERALRKIYLAIASGTFERRPTGSIRTAIGRHPTHRKKMALLEENEGGRPAHTDYRLLHLLPKRKGASQAALVECTLHTGRTHQIRVHLKSIGHPLLGDSVYGRREHYPRQMLHAWKLGFTHPASGEWLEFRAPIPEDFLAEGISTDELV